MTFWHCVSQNATSNVDSFFFILFFYIIVQFHICSQILQGTMKNKKWGSKVLWSTGKKFFQKNPKKTRNIQITVHNCWCDFSVETLHWSLETQCILWLSYNAGKCIIWTLQCEGCVVQQSQNHRVHTVLLYFYLFKTCTKFFFFVVAEEIKVQMVPKESWRSEFTTMAPTLIMIAHYSLVHHRHSYCYA